MSAAQRPRQPWSMKWIVIVILLVIVPYTFIRWHYRKPNRAFEPYHDMKDRANTMRLLSAGFQRIALEADRPVDALRLPATANVSAAAGGLPATLATSLVDTPPLPVDVLSVTAAPTTNPMFAYPISVTCTLADNKKQVAGAHLYAREDQLIVVPEFEKIDGDLLSRSREVQFRITIPPGALKPGQYHVTVAGSRASKTWSLEVK